MEALLLSLAGGAIALVCLWQLRRWLAESEAAAAAGPRRMEALVDELLATAEATNALVEEKAETLAAAVAEADKRLALLAAAAAQPAAAVAVQPAAPPPVPAVPAQPVLQSVMQPVVQAPAPPPAPAQTDPATARVAAAVEAVREGRAPADSGDEGDLYVKVHSLAGAGVSVTAIARQLGLSKGEVQLILGLGKAQAGVKP